MKTFEQTEQKAFSDLLEAVFIGRLDSTIHWILQYSLSTGANEAKDGRMKWVDNDAKDFNELYTRGKELVAESFMSGKPLRTIATSLALLGYGYGHRLFRETGKGAD